MGAGIPVKKKGGTILVERLNGTSWGEIDKEVEIPIFMTHEWQEMEKKISVAEEAYVAAGRGREHRRMRRKLRRRIDGTAVMVIWLLLFTVCAIVEWLCR